MAIARFVSVYPNLETAPASVRQPMARRLIRRRVPRDVSSLEPVRDLVGRTCAEWGCTTIADNARLVTHELVSNALRHARTDADVRLDLRRRTLLIAVSDHDPQPPRLMPVDPALDPALGPRTDGYGLVIVDALARRWGTTPLAGGKLVWAALDSPA